MADSPPPADGSSSLGLLSGVTRALGVLLGLHLQQAQREASNDAGRVIGGVLLLVMSLLFALLALAFAEVAAVWAVRRYTALDWLRSLAVVGAANLLLSVLLALWGRAKLRKPLLQQTRLLLRKTVGGLLDG